jgi:hypothetical protein
MRSRGTALGPVLRVLDGQCHKSKTKHFSFNQIVLQVIFARCFVLLLPPCSAAWPEIWAEKSPTFSESSRTSAKQSCEIEQQQNTKQLIDK